VLDFLPSEYSLTVVKREKRAGAHFLEQAASTAPAPKRIVAKSLLQYCANKNAVSGWATSGTASIE
jgi:hypothetical protein